MSRLLRVEGRGLAWDEIAPGVAAAGRLGLVSAARPARPGGQHEAESHAGRAARR